MVHNEVCIPQTHEQLLISPPPPITEKSFDSQADHALTVSSHPSTTIQSLHINNLEG